MDYIDIPCTKGNTLSSSSELTVSLSSVHISNTSESISTIRPPVGAYSFDLLLVAHNNRVASVDAKIQIHTCGILCEVRPQS